VSRDQAQVSGTTEGGAVSTRTVVVVGGSSGIGLATARAFAAAGDTVHAAARREIHEPSVTAHRLDFTDADAVAAFAAPFERVDALIITAGTNIKERRLHELTPETWDTMIAANLNGPFYVLSAFLDALKAARGTVVIISSVSGAYTDRSGPAYQAAKAGAIKLSHAAGFETDGAVRCTVILPGVVDTDILDNRPEPPTREMRDQMLHAEDVAAACVFAVDLPPRAYIPELTILPTALQAIGKTT
jgi:NADP-dependent 3-hydroxy acid dehydrogenase YdfG